MTKKIECYIDCGSPRLNMLKPTKLTRVSVSPYSYFAFLYLQQNVKALAYFDVEVE